MPSKSDIKIQIDLNTNDVKGQAKSLRDSISNTLKTIDSKTASAEINKIANKLQDLSNISEVLGNKLNAIQRRKKIEIATPTDEFVKLTKELDNAKKGLEKTQKAADKLNARLQRKKDAGAKQDSVSFKELTMQVEDANKEVEKAQQNVDNLHERLTGLIERGKDVTIDKVMSEDNEKEFAATEAELNGVNAEMAQLLNKVASLSYNFTYVGNKFGSVTEAMKSSATALASVIGSMLVSALKKAGEFVLTLAKNFGKFLATKVISGVKTLAKNFFNLAINIAKTVTGISALQKGFSGISSRASDISGALNRGFKTFIKYGFAVRSFFFLFRKLRTVVLEGLQEMGNAYPAFGASINNFKSALETLKYTFVAAFAPIATTVIPILVSLMNTIGAVITRISQLFAALTGQTKFLKAKAVDVTNDYGGAVDGVGKSAGKAKKALDELTIAGFDDVEILKEANDAAGGSGGGSGGGGGAGAVDMAAMFEEVDIEQSIWDFAEKFRALVAAQDWVGLGTFLGENINSVFTKAYDVLTSEDLYNRINSIIDAFGATFNSLVDTIDFEKIGETIAAGFNVVIHAINRFWIDIDFRDLGNGLANAFNGFVNKFNWAELGQLIYNKIHGILTGISEFFKDVDWSGLAKGLKTAIENIHVSELVSQLSETLGNIFGGIGELLYELIVVPVSEYLSAKIDEWVALGGDIGDGLLVGIMSIFVDMLTWVWENVFVPLYEGFKEAFGINSPAKEMAPIGESIGEGVLEALASIFSINSLVSWIQENVFGKLTSAFGLAGNPFDSGVFATFKEAWSSLFENQENDVKLNATVNLSKGKEWSTDAASVIKLKAETIKRTMQQNLKKGSGNNWASDAVAVVKAGAGNLVRNLTQKISKGSWNKDAFNATKIGKASISRSLTQKVINGGISKDALAAAKIGGGTITRTLKVVAKAVNAATQTVIRGVTGINVAIAKHGGVIRNGMMMSLPQFASGGYISGGLAKMWNNIPRYANGALNAGSVFVAGEAGPEIVGNINGRTEILNQSQIASAIYSAVRNAMGEAISRYGTFMSSQIANATNALISAMPYAGTNIIDGSLYKALNTPIPVVVTGGVVPYSTQINTQERISELLSRLDDKINATPNNFTIDELQSILINVITRYANTTLYIGDEQIARHANAGNLALSRRYSPSTAGN